jgi:hypothetical protein
MTPLLPTLATAFAALCVWLTVRIVNRKEQWAKWTLAAALGVSVLFVLSFEPARWPPSSLRTGGEVDRVRFRWHVRQDSAELIAAGNVPDRNPQLEANDGSVSQGEIDSTPGDTAKYVFHGKLLLDRNGRVEKENPWNEARKTKRRLPDNGTDATSSQRHKMSAKGADIQKDRDSDEEQDTRTNHARDAE